LNGIRNINSVKNSFSSKEEVPELRTEEDFSQQNKDTPSQKQTKASNIFKHMQLQLSVCLVIFLSILLLKTINNNFYASVRAGTFEKSYRYTNLYDINTRLDALASQNKFLAFILGRSSESVPVFNQNEQVSFEEKTDIQEEEESSQITQTLVSPNSYSPFSEIAFIDEPGLLSSTEEDDTKAQVQSSQTTKKFPEYDTVVHDIPCTYYNPVKSYITSYFGIRKDPITKNPSFHTGVDIGIKTGTDIISPMDGTIEKTGYSSVWGNYILVNHQNGFETFYAHLSKIKVKKGQKVFAKTLLGLSGNTGRSTGPHLHFEVHYNGVYQDPLLYFDFK